MDRMDIINCWINMIPVQIPGLGQCQIYGVEKEDGSGYSFNLTIAVSGATARRKVYVSVYPGKPVVVKTADGSTSMTKGSSRVKTSIAR